MRTRALKTLLEAIFKAIGKVNSLNLNFKEKKDSNAVHISIIIISSFKDRFESLLSNFVCKIPGKKYCITLSITRLNESNFLKYFS